MFDFPLSMSFKILAVAPQVMVTDASGQQICYVRQKLFKLKEKIIVYGDESKQKVVTEIEADRIIDFSASYSFSDPQGETYGSVKRRGMRSLWRSHYEVFDERGEPAYTIREKNPWSKVGDGLFGEIPIVGMLAGYLFHPRYEMTDPDGRVCYSLRKQPAFFEGRFEFSKDTDDGDDLLALMSVLMMTLLERSRG